MPTVNSHNVFEAGEILYVEGSENKSVFIVAEGEVLLHRQVDGQRVDLEIRPAGSVVGELSVLTAMPRAVTAQARTRCRVFELPADLIFARFEKLDPVLRACVETSINFTAKMSEPTTAGHKPVEKGAITLRNTEQLLEVLNLGDDIITGLENREFNMFYQPIVRLSDGSIVGFEALMRWNHPQYGFVSPDKFIPVAEEMGSITKLTQFALSKACAALRRFNDEMVQSDDLYMSVNISGVDIGQSEFPDFLDHVLDLNGLDQRLLRLELTETALVPASDVASANLQRLQEQGFKISVDDFGTGYSNLAYLKHLPLTALKIDRAFAGDADQNTVSKSIVRMLVTLGQELGVDIVAEGLETEGSAHALRDLGCLFAQGYYYYKPMPAKEALDVLTNQHRDRQLAIA